MLKKVSVNWSPRAGASLLYPTVERFPGFGDLPAGIRRVATVVEAEAVLVTLGLAAPAFAADGDQQLTHPFAKVLLALRETLRRLGSRKTHDFRSRVSDVAVDQSDQTISKLAVIVDARRSTPIIHAVGRRGTASVPYEQAGRLLAGRRHFFDCFRSGTAQFVVRIGFREIVAVDSERDFPLVAKLVTRGQRPPGVSGSRIGLAESVALPPCGRPTRGPGRPSVVSPAFPPQESTIRAPRSWLRQSGRQPGRAARGGTRREVGIMARYLLVESRDPFESRDCEVFTDLAVALAARGNEVDVFLVQNAVSAARKGARLDLLSKLVSRQINVLADAFSLRERGIPPERLAAGVEPSDIDVVIDRLEDGSKVIWH